MASHCLIPPTAGHPGTTLAWTTMAGLTSPALSHCPGPSSLLALASCPSPESYYSPSLGLSDSHYNQEAWLDQGT